MQTLDSNAVIVPTGYMLWNVTLTASGRDKVTAAFDYHYRGGWKLEETPCAANDPFFRDKYHREDYGTADQLIEDIEKDAMSSESHPVCVMEGQNVPLIQGIDYYFEFKSWQVWELEKIAAGLNDLHEVMETEMDRLGW